MGNKIFAGLLSGLLLAAVFTLYYLMRGRAFVATQKASSADMADLSDNALFFMFLGGFVFGALLLGIISGIVYRFVGTPESFRLLAIGMAVLASLLAAISRTPLPADKVFMNMAVAAVLGVLVPFLSARFAG